MQMCFEVGDYLVTTSVTTAGLNPALVVMVVTWNPPPAVLTYGERERYHTGVADALKRAASVLGAAPMVVEPPLPACMTLPRSRRGSG